MTENAQAPFRRQEAMSQQLGFDIPTELCKLPSAGQLYAPDHPFCSMAEVELRTMTAREEDLLTSRALIKQGSVIDKLLESCLTCKGVDAGSLLQGDRNALLVALRVISYGSEYSAKITCPQCDHASDHKFTLQGLKIKPLGAQPIQPNVNAFSYQLPLSKLNIQLRLLTGADEREISQANEKRRKLGNIGESLITTRLLYSTLSISNEQDRSKISTIISNLRAGDSLAYRKYIDKIEPGIDMSQPFKCVQCQEDSEVNVPLGASFFWPDLG